ncbi:MAG: hypothetical protein WBF77_07005 [Sulfurimonadaceae bacterium]
MRPLLKEITLSVIAVMLLGAVPAVVQAEELPDRGPVPFHLYDKDGNNLISEDEFYDLRAKRMQKRADDGFPMRNAGNAPDFSEFDSNGDGMLSPEELSAGQQAQMSKRRGTKGKGQGQGPGAK